MTSQITLNINTSTTTPPPSPRSELPNISSLTATNVLNSKNLQGPEKSSANAMQTVQIQQSQPTIVPTLSPSRVTTSVADDLDALLDDTLEEFEMTINSSPVQTNSSTIQSTTISNSNSICIEESFHIESILVIVLCMGLVDSAPVMGMLFKDEMAEHAQAVNKAIEMINSCFKSLLEHSDNPGSWLEEQKSKTSFYCKCHPFAASYFLLTSLDKATSLQSDLNPILIAEWKKNYEQCVILLKKRSLDRYIETEFPFSPQMQPMLSMIKMAQEMGRKQNSQNLDEVQAIQEKITNNPECIPEIKEAMMSQMLQMMGGMGDFGIGGPEAIKQEPQIKPLISFFEELDLVLKENPNNAQTVEFWLEAKATQSTYLHPFACSKNLLQIVKGLPVEIYSIDETVTELESLYETCCKQLVTLGLQKYIDEIHPERIEMIRKHAISQKEKVQLILSKSLAVLRPLSEELKKLNLVSDESMTNRQVIEQWLLDCKKTELYFPPFVVGMEFCEFSSVYEEVLDKNLLAELKELLPFCQEHLLQLGLGTYVKEFPI